MGVAGAHMTSKAILITGLSGLVAGACAMAMGEWLSSEEEEQLANIYLAQGISAAEARSLADRLDATRTEDFGGYAWNAALWSFSCSHPALYFRWCPTFSYQVPLPCSRASQ